MKGVVKDTTGMDRYKLYGKFNESLTVVNLLTRDETVIWKMRPLPHNSHNYYYFT